MKLAAAASVIGAVCLGWFVLLLQADYATDSGAPQRFELEDGSTVFLDADSAVDLKFSAGRRDVELLAGAAFFEVAPDRERPFVVQGLGVSATALGTAYGVRREGHSVTVIVKHGVVRVEEGTESVELHANQSVATTADSDGLGKIQHINADSALSWQRGRLTFDRAPLSVVVQELNRYRDGYIIVADSSIGALPVSGVFRIDRADDVLATLEQALDIRVRRMTDYLVLLDRPVGFP